jgi:hypothetical protein
MSRTTVYDHVRPYSPGWGDIHLINPGEVPQGNIRKEKINWEAFTMLGMENQIQGCRDWLLGTTRPCRELADCSSSGGAK